MSWRRAGPGCNLAHVRHARSNAKKFRSRLILAINGNAPKRAEVISRRVDVRDAATSYGARTTKPETGTRTSADLAYAANVLLSLRPAPRGSRSGGMGIEGTRKGSKLSCKAREGVLPNSQWQGSSTKIVSREVVQRAVA